MSAMNMDIDSEATCIGTSAQDFGDCIVSVHKDKDRWTRLRQGGLEFIARTHSRRHLSQSVERYNSQWNGDVSQ